MKKTNDRLTAYFQIHIAVVLFGFTAILGHLINLPETAIVWHRMGLTTLSLLLFPGLVAKVRKIPQKEIFRLMGIGLIIALHWALFFGAIKKSNVSVTLSVFASTTFMTAILEPLMTRRKFKWHELALGAIVIPGIYIIYRSTEFYLVGILMALISALLAVVFSVLNKKMVDKHDALAITLLELGSGWLLFSPLVAFFYFQNPGELFLPTLSDSLYLAILAIICTSVAFYITLKALKVLSAFTINLSINLEPVYGILLAFFLFEEHKSLDWGFFVGAGVIMLTVFIHPFLEKYFGENEKARA